MGCCCSGENRIVIESRPLRKEPTTLATRLHWRDVLGGWAARWGVGRMRFRVEPGLYRVGVPDRSAPVLVTANYKLTVDALRRELDGVNAWLLVLDTKGINVWCAAGKGTFGTSELVRSIEAARLHDIVDHRHLILPQLGAVGIEAHKVKQTSGFLVHYGPVLARDLKTYLASGRQATPAMRRVPFTWRDRLVLAPVELVGALKPALAVVLVLALLHLAIDHRLSLAIVRDAIPFLVAFVTGGLLVPVLLPFLPFQSFALKGLVAGLVPAMTTVALSPVAGFEAAGTILISVGITSYMAMMFTGSTTFTTYAGARLEVRRAVPLILVAVAAGTLLRMWAVVA